MLETYNRLPNFLQNYCAVQYYERYTAQDQAVWRYALKQLVDFLSQHAVPVYREGLRKTGIALESIPRLADMDKALADFGWGAAAVEGFIPPIIFLEFQARRVLPIAVDIRRFAHLSYTPAPDIIHEAAGHAPIIADPEYADYLTRYAELAQKAIFSDHDIRLYEAIRYLSDIKEMRGISQEMIDAAQARLDAVTAEKAEVSEAGKVARLYWWTAEYGLVGSLSSPRLYGAGLLSSVMESKSCLGDGVRKLPLSKEAVNTAYDITEPQPQLFVARDFADLHQTLSDVEQDMSYKLGGLEGLRRAKKSLTVNTCQLDSGLQVSGRLTHFVGDDVGRVSWLRLRGRCQFSVAHRQLTAQGSARHKDGCRVLLGSFADLPNKPPWLLSNSDLEQMGVRVGQRVRVALTGGCAVEGVVLRWYRQNGQLLYITWADYKITRGARVLQTGSDAEYDMPIGSAVVSVFGGPADREAFGSYSIGKASSCPHTVAEFSERERELFALYATVRELRQQNQADLQVLERSAEQIVATYPEQWLLALELCEAAERHGIDDSAGWLRRVQEIARPPADAAA